MCRYVIIFVNCITFENDNIIQVYMQKLSRKKHDECFYLVSNEAGCSSDNEMTFDTFRRILASMTKAELVNLRKNINNDKKGIIKSMLDDEYKRRHMYINKNKKDVFNKLVKVSQLERGK